MMDDDRIEVTGRVVVLYDSSLEIVAEIVCKDEDFCSRICETSAKPYYDKSHNANKLKGGSDES